MGRYATTMGRRTAARLARLAPPPPPTLSAPRPTAMPTMAAQARFFTWVRGRVRVSRVRGRVSLTLTLPLTLTRRGLSPR